MRPYRLIPAFLLLALAACGPGHDDWLAGGWELAHNPQEDSEDRLVFDGRGRLTIHRADGERLHGRYRRDGDDLHLSLTRAGREIEASFRISPDRERLIYHNGAYYTRETDEMGDTGS